ncbi:hypothetical protein [Streptomyces sp. NBC_01462]|uniref:hypothetical protein n=1 Tax=Streptomyces sp. NBC_01462 TaxID=2903876 RepID=UPI002E33CC71|nr:hypothetical protein [Streptomyces sp. NBC_01462]
MQTFAHFILRHRRWVIGFWLVVLLAGGTAAGRLPDRLSSDFSLPGQEGSETQAALARTYGVSADLGYLPVLTAPARPHHRPRGRHRRRESAACAGRRPGAGLRRHR